MITEINKALITTSILVLLVLFWMYHFLIFAQSGWNFASYNFISVSIDYLNSLVFSLSAAIVIFIFTGGILKKYNDLAVQEQTHMIRQIIESIFHTRPPSDFNSFDWKTLMKTSKRIRISVHYLDSWIDTHSTDIKDFFVKGGLMEYHTPNPNNIVLIQAIASRFPKLDHDKLKMKIESSIEKLKELATEAGKDADVVLKSKYLEHVPWTCIMIFDDLVVISPYEHFVKVGVRSPVIPLNIKESTVLNEWVDREFSVVVYKS